MLEILLIIAVVKLFTKKAQEKGLSKGLWGFIGAASYYVPVFFTGWFILPAMVESGSLQFSTEMSAMLALVGISIGAGVVCCFVAYRILVAQPDAIKEDEGLLDQDL
ncbi:MAG: hypothetical protein MI810_19025 [Flavobacteriales bacterium]|jgi:hypothetical protein|nr:hypothetical protein [Flavobacteriales bacterium]